MVSNTSRRHLPPYISYRTFRNFIEELRKGIPARIDRRYWGDRLSGSNGNHIIATLRFLSLIDAASIPTSRLRNLVSAKDEQRTEILKEMASEAYSFLHDGSFDPKTATYDQLQEVFRDGFPSTIDVRRKCINFFVSLASDSGIPLSSFIIERFRTAHRSTGTKPTIKRTGTKIRPKITSTRTNRNSLIPQSVEKVPVRAPWDEMLLTKFPTFDPTWPDEVKLKWFEAFDQLLKGGLTKGDKLR